MIEFHCNSTKKHIYKIPNSGKSWTTRGVILNFYLILQMRGGVFIEVKECEDVNIKLYFDQSASRDLCAPNELFILV